MAAVTRRKFYDFTRSHGCQELTWTLPATTTTSTSTNSHLVDPLNCVGWNDMELGLHDLWGAASSITHKARLPSPSAWAYWKRHRQLCLIQMAGLLKPRCSWSISKSSGSELLSSSTFIHLSIYPLYGSKDRCTRTSNHSHAAHLSLNYASGNLQSDVPARSWSLLSALIAGLKEVKPGIVCMGAWHDDDTLSSTRPGSSVSRHNISSAGIVLVTRPHKCSRTLLLLSLKSSSNSFIRRLG